MKAGNKRLNFIAALFISAVLALFSGCGSLDETAGSDETQSSQTSREREVSESGDEDISTQEEEETESSSEEEETVSLDDIPEYDGEPYVVINDNEPFFEESDLTDESYESYSELDELGRCGEAIACIGTDLMPTGERESISSVHPSGWHSVSYDFVDGNSLYNRCHLIGYQLSGENANEENLITGTRYMNVDGMLPFENMVADYVEETQNHVLYRVTPIFEGDNLVASGVLMEAESVEDEGEGILFNVYVYNVQPGVIIDYATGESEADEDYEEDVSETEGDGSADDEDSGEDASASLDEDSGSDTGEEEITYVLNTNTMKFHYSDCKSVSQMSEKNKLEYTGTRSEIIEMGYDPCGNCNP